MEPENPLGLILPLYIYPGPSWQIVVEEKGAHKSTPFLAVINPASGPGRVQDPEYVSGIKELQMAKIIVLGYIFTSYSSRKHEDAARDVDTYRNWYGVDGVMFDEMDVSHESEAYYSSLDAYAKSVGMTVTVGNPGRALPPGYCGTMSILNIYEDMGVPDSLPSSTTLTRGREKLSAIAYGVKDFNSFLIESISKSIGFLFLTDATLPNPYGNLPSYFSRLVEALGREHL